MDVKTNARLPKIGPNLASTPATFPAPHTPALALHRVRNGLPVEAALYVGACLPLHLRGMYFEGWSAMGSLSPRRWDDAIGPARSNLSDLARDLLSSIPDQGDEPGHTC